MKKSLYSLIYQIIKEGKCYDAWKFVEKHCANGSYKIQGIDFDQSYSPVAHADFFIINITITDMHRFTVRIFYVSNASHNTIFPINSRVCVIPSHYYLDWFGKSYSIVPLNQDKGPFFIQ